MRQMLPRQQLHSADQRQTRVGPAAEGGSGDEGELALKLSSSLFWLSLSL